MKTTPWLTHFIRVARLPKIQYGKVMESYGNLKKIGKNMKAWKKNVENMENAQKALKYAIKSFYFLKKHVFYTPKSSQCNAQCGVLVLGLIF